MLVQLTSEQISEQWDIIAKSIDASMPPYAYSSQMKINRVLEEMLKGNMQAWMAYDEKKVSGLTAIAIVVTAFQFDQFTDSKSLLIYSLYGIDRIPEYMWKEGLATIIKFARANECFRIIGYTDVPRIVEVVNELGGDSAVRFISLEV